MLRVNSTHWLRYRTHFRLPHSYNHLENSPLVKLTPHVVIRNKFIGRSIGTQTDSFSQSVRSEPPTITTTVIDPIAESNAAAAAAFQDLLGVSTPNTNDDELKDTFYQRELPKSLIRFASPEGKKLFREAMDDDHAEGFFPLTGNFTTQSEPAYCGPSSLAMVLNALEVDPKKRWKGNWRWFSDEFLQCCSSKEEMKKNGITFDNFACLAKCHCDVQVKRAFDFTLEDFKRDVETITSNSDKFIVISFARKILGQTGDGHFSPIGAYNAKTGNVLVLDTARYKYPSYWCPIETLFESMKPIDKETGRPRGYFILSYDSEHPPINLCTIKADNYTTSKAEQLEEQHALQKRESVAVQQDDVIDITKAKLNWSTIAKSFCKRIPENMWLEKPRTLNHVVQLVLRNVPEEYTSILASQSLASFNASTPDKAENYINQLLHDTTKSPLYPIVMDALYPNRENQSYTPIDCDAAFATLFVLGSPRMLYTSLPKDIQDCIDQYRKEKMTAVMKREVKRISEEVIDLTTSFCTCGPNWTDPSNNSKDAIKSSHCSSN